MSKIYHFLLKERHGKTRHIGIGSINEEFQIWSCKPKGLNPTVGLRESVANHTPSNSGENRYDREERFRLHMESAYLTDSLEDIQEALNSYTGMNWTLYKIEER